MKNIKVKTLEDIIVEETKDSNGYFFGVFSDTTIFYIADKNFNILFETTPFDDKGHWTNDVKKAFIDFGIVDNFSNVRTEKNIEELKESIKLEYDIQKMYIDRINKK